MAEAIVICLDNSSWMENIESPMFKEQLSAMSLYIKRKLFENPLTEVAVFGMADYDSSFSIRPTRDLEGIMIAIKHGVMTIGGPLRFLEAAAVALFRLTCFDPLPEQKRIVIFAGGAIHCPLHKAQKFGTRLKGTNVACDVISFGTPYMCKREIFDTLISYANNNGNCHACHVPPESSIRAALSRSQIFITHAGGRSCSAQSSSLQYDKNKAIDIRASSLQYDQNKSVDIYVKSPSDGADFKTDCPFCQTVLLTLEEKGISYNTHFIDLHNKPKGIFKQNQETLPLIMFHDGTRVSSSDVIVEMIDKMYPGRSLVTSPHFAHLGLKILPKLAAFLKTKDEDDKQALVYELHILDNHLRIHGHDYVNGKEITAVDLSLAPKLYHVVNACSCDEDNWNVLQDHPYVQTYTKRLFKSDSFTRTKPCPQNVLEGWHKRLPRK